MSKMIKDQEDLILDYQFFASDPDGIPTLNDLYSEFGIDPDKPQDSPAGDTPPVEPEKTEPIAPEGTEPESTAPPDDPNTPELTGDAPPAEPDPQTQLQADKAGRAFAQMRTENKQLNDVVKGIAEVLKVDTSNPEAMLSALQNLVIEGQAKNQGIAPDIYKRLTTLEQENSTYKAQQIENNAYLGFGKVKTEYGLTDQALDNFVGQLVAHGKNPFIQELDLVQEYKILNFESILQSKIDAAVKAEQQRAAEAVAHGSAPNGSQGVQPGTQEKITTMDQLNSWVASIDKK